MWFHKLYIPDYLHRKATHLKNSTGRATGSGFYGQSREIQDHHLLMPSKYTNLPYFFDLCLYTNSIM